MAIQDSINSLWHSAGTAFSTIRVLSAAEALKAEKAAKAAEVAQPKKTEEQIAAEKKEALVNKLVSQEPVITGKAMEAANAFSTSFKNDNMLDDADKTTRAGKKSKAANAEKTRNKYIEMYEKANKELSDFQESKSLQVNKKTKKGGSI